jgi:phosphoenolpyruvate carboxykinase (GTP)
MEARVHNEVGAIETPIGLIPKYDDLKLLFRQIFSRDYTIQDYEDQFSMRVDNLLTKLERIEAIFEEERDIPDVFWKHLKQQQERLLRAKEKYGNGVISPFEFM